MVCGVDFGSVSGISFRHDQANLRLFEPLERRAPALGPDARSRVFVSKSCDQSEREMNSDLRMEATARALKLLYFRRVPLLQSSRDILTIPMRFARYPLSIDALLNV